MPVRTLKNHEVPVRKVDPATSDGLGSKMDCSHCPPVASGGVFLFKSGGQEESMGECMVRKSCDDIFDRRSPTTGHLPKAVTAPSLRGDCELVTRRVQETLQCFLVGGAMLPRLVMDHFNSSDFSGSTFRVGVEESPLRGRPARAGARFLPSSESG